MVTFLTYDQIKALITQPMAKRTQALIAFQYASGCRIGELLNYHHHSNYIDKKTGEIIQKEHDTTGLLKKNVAVNPEMIRWTMPNFKTKKTGYLTKNVMVSLKEKWLYDIIKDWLENCNEQVFELRESWARNLIREQLPGYGSHVLRHSRATHAVELFGYTPYELMPMLGHTQLDSGRFYVEAVAREKKMLEGLSRIEQVPQ